MSVAHYTKVIVNTRTIWNISRRDDARTFHRHRRRSIRCLLMANKLIPFIGSARHRAAGPETTSVLQTY